MSALKKEWKPQIVDVGKWTSWTQWTQLLWTPSWLTHVGNRLAVKDETLMEVIIESDHSTEIRGRCGHGTFHFLTKYHFLLMCTGTYQWNYGPFNFRGHAGLFFHFSTLKRERDRGLARLKKSHFRDPQLTGLNSQWFSLYWLAI